MSAERRGFLEHGIGRPIHAVGLMVSDLVGRKDVHRMPKRSERRREELGKTDIAIMHLLTPGIAKAISYRNDPNYTPLKGAVGLLGGTALDLIATVSALHTLGGSLIAERVALSASSGIVNEARHGGAPQGSRRGIRAA